jgi:hypothetical protein
MRKRSLILTKYQTGFLTCLTASSTAFWASGEGVYSLTRTLAETGHAWMVPGADLPPD